jgi:hypothetical protein
MNYAPIILFAYDRPDHTKITLDALSENVEAKDSLLFIFCDGIKSNANPIQIERINKTKEIALQEDRFKSVKVITSNFNRGLSKSVITGVTEIVNEYDKVIVLEDDLVVDRWFLNYMNDALNCYEFVSEVACISGYIYPVNKPMPNTFFIKGADCWGWATWKRAWDLLDNDGKKLLNEIERKKLCFDFDFYNSYPYVEMLKDQINGKNNSWAILWYASAYLSDKLTLYPSKSLVNNIGIDGTGTHSGYSSYFDVKLLNQKVLIEKIEIIENVDAKKIISEYFSRFNKIRNISFFKRIIKKIKQKLFIL